MLYCHWHFPHTNEPQRPSTQYCQLSSMENQQVSGGGREFCPVYVIHAFSLSHLLTHRTELTCSGRHEGRDFLFASACPHQLTTPYASAIKPGCPLLRGDWFESEWSYLCDVTHHLRFTNNPQFPHSFLPLIQIKPLVSGRNTQGSRFM